MDDKKKFDDNASFEDLANRYIGKIDPEAGHAERPAAPGKSGVPLTPPVRKKTPENIPVRRVEKEERPVPERKTSPRQSDPLYASKKRNVHTEKPTTPPAVKNNYQEMASRYSESQEMRTSAPRSLPVQQDQTVRDTAKQNAVPTRAKKEKKQRKNKGNDVYDAQTGTTQKTSDKKASFLTRMIQREGAKNTYVFFGIVIFLSVAISIYAVFCVNDILAFSKNEEEVTITSTDTTTTNEAIKMLYENRLINCPNFCKLFAKFRSDQIGGPYTSGIFSLNGKMGLEGMLVTLKGDVAVTETVTLTFPEGYTVYDIVQKLAENEVCDKNALYKAIEEGGFTFALSAALKTDDKVPFRLEGYLFPDTYDFYVGEDPNSVLKKFLSNLEDNITQEDRAQAEKLGMTVDEVLTLASIIEKEAANKKQMPIVSSILHNRINNPSLLPRLECNSTADYITRSVSKSLTVNSAHNADYYMQFYNTYSIQGLPAGPICNPGKDAIQAALHPDKTDLYFFCHDAKGNMYTAKTAQEHKINVSKYLAK